MLKILVILCVCVCLIGCEECESAKFYKKDLVVHKLTGEKGFVLGYRCSSGEWRYFVDLGKGKKVFSGEWELELVYREEADYYGGR